MGRSPKAYLFFGIIEPEVNTWFRYHEDEEEDLEEQLKPLGVDLIYIYQGDERLYALALSSTRWVSMYCGTDVRPFVYDGTRFTPGTTDPEWVERIAKAAVLLKVCFDERDYYKKTAEAGWILTANYS
jgi:hypothetical protein